MIECASKEEAMTPEDVDACEKYFVQSSSLMSKHIRGLGSSADRRDCHLHEFVRASLRVTQSIHTYEYLKFNYYICT